MRGYESALFGAGKCRNLSGPVYLPKIETQEEFDLLIKMVAPLAVKNTSLDCCNAWVNVLDDILNIFKNHKLLKFGVLSSDGVTWNWSKDGIVATIRPEWWAPGD